MSTITDLTFKNDLSVEFCWTLTRNDDDGDWSQKSDIFSIDTFQRQCTLHVKFAKYCHHFFSWVFEIHFVQSYVYYKNENFILTVSLHKGMQDSNTFKLSKTDDSDQIFQSKGIYIPLTHFSFVNTKKLYVTLFCLKSNINCGLLQDIKKLLNDENADCKIITKDHVFKAHKSILSVRSNVISKMMNTNMIEKKTGEIKLEDWDSAVVAELLTYIYTNFCDVGKCVYDLFKLAHYLDISELKQLCAEYIEINVNEQNIIQILELANIDQYNLQDLKKHAENFIALNKLVLLKNPDYIKYLYNTVNLENFMDILKFSMDYKIENLLARVMEFFRLNHKEIIQNAKSKNLLLNNSECLMHLYEYSLNTLESQLLLYKIEV